MESMVFNLTSVYPETAYFGPILRFRIFFDPRRKLTALVEDPVIFSGRSKKSCGLALNHNQLFLDGH